LNLQQFHTTNHTPPYANPLLKNKIFNLPHFPFAPLKPGGEVGQGGGLVLLIEVSYW
jgi:hypothetical protein